MKILLVHNRYLHYGGEDAVVDAEVALLQRYGHEVLCYFRDNQELASMPAATAATALLWSRRSSRDIARLCRQFRPDVVHAHNLFPLISPSAYWAAARCGVPVVQSLHNFRILCPQAILLRNETVCDACVGKLPWRAVLHRCYRDSRVESAAVAAMLVGHRIAGSYQKRVSRYITLNSFCRDKFIAGGLPPQRLCIKPNFIDAQARDTRSPTPPSVGRSGGLYVGRLSSEKGIQVLVRAHAEGHSPQLSLIGDGPLSACVTAHFGARASGFLPLDAVLQRMRGAAYLVLPSICQESAPRTLVEAFACGLPVIASRIGGLVDMVTDGMNGLHVRPGDAADLAAKMHWADQHPDEMTRMGRAARAAYESRYTPQRNHALLSDIYRAAIERHDPDPQGSPAGEPIAGSAARQVGSRISATTARSKESDHAG